MRKRCLLFVVFLALFVFAATSAFASQRVVVSGHSDRIEYILDDLGWDYTLINGDALAGFDLSNVRELYLNCESDSQYFHNNIDKVRRFVEGGGYLFVSDLDFDYVHQWGLRSAFDGISGNVTATIVDPGLRSFMQQDTIQIFYDMGSWARITELAGATVLLRGNVPTFGGMVQDSPLLVTFRAGSGRVVFTTFHYYANMTDDVRQALMYLVSLPGSFAGMDDLLEELNLDPAGLVGIASNSLSVASSAGISVQGINGANGRYLFQVTGLTFGTPEGVSSILATPGFTVELTRDGSTEPFATRTVVGNYVYIDVSAAYNDGSAWTFNVTDSTGFNNNQKVVAASWLGDSTGTGNGGNNGGTGGGGGGGGCNVAAGLLAVLLALPLVFRKKK